MLRSSLGALNFFEPMLSTEIQHLIEETVQATMPEAFLVSLALKRGRQNVLDLKVDTDAGITMEECAGLSRAVGRVLEDRVDFDFSYTLQVSSPGVGTPLVMHRQYLKNVGRHLQVTRQDGRTQQGLLKAVDDQQLTLELLPEKKRKGKQAEATGDPLTLIPFADIKEAKVIILF